MKKIILISGMLVCGHVFQSCNSGGSADKKNSTDSAMSMNDSTRKNVDTVSSTVSSQPVDKACADFSVKAASGGMMEVQLGKIALDRALSKRVKDFGAMMVQDHTKANNDLIGRAKSQNITLPATVGDDEQKMIDNISRKTGKDFDKAYMDMMLDDHKNDIAEFKKAAEKCTNASIKDFASQALPVLEKHLDSAQAITRKN